MELKLWSEVCRGVLEELMHSLMAWVFFRVAPSNYESL